MFIMSNKLLLFSVVRACNPVARITYTVMVETLNHAQSKRACNLQWPCSFFGKLFERLLGVSNLVHSILLEKPSGRANNFPQKGVA